MDSKNTDSFAKKSSVVVIGSGATLVIRFTTNVLLSWFLMPEDFGVAAIIIAVLIGLALLSDVGIGDAIVRNPKGEVPEFYYSAFVVQIIRGLVLYVVLVSIAGFVADFYQKEILRSTLLVAGVSLLFDGFYSTRMYVLQRLQRIREQTVMELTVQVVAGVFVVTMSIILQSVWALVINNVFAAALRMVLSYFFAPFPLKTHPFRVHWEYIAEILHFGKWIILSTLFFYVITQSDKLFIGKLASISELGVYSLAVGFAGILMALATTLLARIVYPLLSEAARVSKVEFEDRLAESLRQVLRILVLMTLIFIAVSPLFFRYFYKSEYAAAGEIAQAAVIMIWFMMLFDLFNKVPVSYGKPEVGALSSFISAAARVVLSVAGFHYYGVEGFLGGLTVGSLVGLAYVYTWLRGNGLRHSFVELKFCLVVVGLYAVVRASRGLSPLPDEYTEMVVAALILVGVAASAYRLYGERVTSFVLARVR